MLDGAVGPTREPCRIVAVGRLVGRPRPPAELCAPVIGERLLDAGTVVQSDGVDGVHLTGESQRKLGTAMAARVAALLAGPRDEEDGNG